MTELINNKQYSLEEVKQHNKENDCWIVIGDKVFDVTKFLNLHPAGKNILLQYAGKDATDIFKYFHNSEMVLHKYNKLIIGSLKDYQQQELASILQFNNTFGDGIPFGDPNYIQGWNSPYYNDTHKQLRAAVRTFTKINFEPFIEEWEANESVPKEIRKKCADAGLLALCIGHPWPIKWAPTKIVLGVDLKNSDSFHEFILRDEIARIGSVGVLRGLLTGASIGLPPIIKFGSEELQQRIVTPCMKGEKLICLVITEPWVGSDVSGIQCKAVLNFNKTHYIVNGMKKWITNGMFCDYFTTAVRTSDNGMNGISLLLIESAFKGVKTRKIKCSGDYSSGTAFIILEDVEVPVQNLIGKEGKGFQQIMINFNHERLQMCQWGCRLARTCLEESMKFSHKRKTFGKRLIDHPVIRNKLGNMACKVEALQAYIEVCCFNFDRMNQQTQNQLLSGGIALLKVQTTQTIEFCAKEAIQIFGGLGYTKGGLGSKVERIYREAKGVSIPGGSEEILLDLGIRQSSKLMPKM